MFKKCKQKHMYVNSGNEKEKRERRGSTYQNITGDYLWEVELPTIYFILYDLTVSPKFSTMNICILVL